MATRRKKKYHVYYERDGKTFRETSEPVCYTKVEPIKYRIMHEHGGQVERLWHQEASVFEERQGDLFGAFPAVHGQAQS